jgi:hypothetical protein
MMFRTILTLSVICIYTALFNLYIYELTHTYWDVHYVKLFYNYLTLGMLLFHLIDHMGKFKGFFHEQFNLVCVWLIVTNYLIIIANRHGWLSDTFRLTICFNTSVLLTTIIILWTGVRNRTLKY